MSTNKPITTKQIQLISMLIHKQGLTHHKAEIMEGVSSGRTNSTKGLTAAEASDLIAHLTQTSRDTNVSSKLMKKLFALAFEMGWCPHENRVMDGGEIKKVRNYTRLHEWVLKYGYLKKPLREYRYNELPKLVSIFETKIYNPYIENINKKESTDNQETNPF